MSSLAAFNEIIRQNEPLAPFTWMKVGGSARYLASPRNEEELTQLVRHCHAEEIPMRVLGGGSNLLVRDEAGLASLTEADRELPVLYFADCVHAEELGLPGLRGLLDVREKFGPGVALRGVRKA